MVLPYSENTAIPLFFKTYLSFKYHFSRLFFTNLPVVVVVTYTRLLLVKVTLLRDFYFTPLQ
jgi:hypothetical protein